MADPALEPQNPADTAMFAADDVEVSRTVDVFLEATLALSQDIYRSEAVTHDLFKMVHAEIAAGGISEATAARLTDRARRTITAHFACFGIIAKRRMLIAEGDKQTLAAIDTAIFNTIFAATLMAHMGEDRLSTMEGLAELRLDRASRSDGGKKGNLSRTRWHAETRERYDRYRSLNPSITQATRIQQGILKWGPIKGSPSEDRILAVVRKWMKEPAHYRKETDIH